MQRDFFLSAVIVSASAVAYAQEQPDPRMLMPSPILNAIAQHISDEKPGSYSIASR